MTRHLNALRTRIDPIRTLSFFLSSLCITGMLSAPFMSSAQDLRNLDPTPPPPQVEAPEGSMNPTPAPVAPDNDERILVDALRGVVFLDRKDAAAPKADTPPDGIDVTRVERLKTPAFRKRMEPYLGQPVSTALLNRMAADVHVYYIERDMPFVSVSLPEQDITAGVVQFRVIEGALGTVSVEGAKWFSANQYLSAMRLGAGDPIRLSVIKEDIAWINRNPFRQANLFFDQGESEGLANLVLRTRESIPVRMFAGWHNNGSETTDRNQAFAGFNWGNAFGFGHQFSYQYSTSPDFQQINGHGGSYAIPLPWRDFLTISGTYSKIKPEMADPFRQNGMSGKAALQYDTDLPAIGLLRHSAGLVFEYKVSDNNLLFGGIPVTDNRTDILQLSWIYTGEITDPWGGVSFGFRLTGSPGGLSSRNKTRYFEITRAFADADYLYGTLDLARTQRLPFNFSLMLSGHLQYAEGNLLGSEQLGLGGSSTIRGYNEGILYGDRGYILRMELNAPPIHIDQWMPFSSGPAPLLLLGFYDHGATGPAERLPGQSRDHTLKSAGVGCRLAVSRHVSMSCDYGWRLKRFTGVNYHSMGHFSMTLSY